MKFKIPPWEHQLKALDLMRPRQEFALFFEQGAGKTGTTINAIREKMNTERRDLKVLVLCPLIVVENWKREFEMHSSIDPIKVVALEGSGAQKAALLQARSKDKAHVFITNYDALQNKDLLARILEWAPEVLVCDESQRLKNPKAVRTKLATQIADITKYRYILSGTPITNSAMDVFSQYRILDKGETFGKNFFSFRAVYFEDKNAGMPKQKYFPNWQPRASTYELLNTKIYQKAMRVLKKDCLDLPPLIRQRVYTDGMDPEQKKHYYEMRDEFITFLNDKACTAELAIVKALRLQQIVSGYLKLEDGTEFTYPKAPRLAALAELLDDLTPRHKVIVWATFRKNYEQIAKVCESVGAVYTSLTGDQSQRDKVLAVDTFTNDPNVRVIIANQAAGGVGINLVQASVSIFYSRNFSLEADLQAEARNYRGGSEIHRAVTRIDLVTKDTIDELVLEALTRKQSISDCVLKWKGKL